MSTFNVGDISLRCIRLTEEGLLHYFHFEAHNPTKNDLYISIDRANAYYQSEGRFLIKGGQTISDLKLPVRLFGDSWQKETMVLSFCISEFIPNPDYDRQMEEYYADPDVQEPREMVYSTITTRSVNFKLR